MIYTIRIHEVDSTVTYLGRASPGSLETAEVWQLQKLETIAGTLRILYPEGEHGFNYPWSQHESYTYL